MSANLDTGRNGRFVGRCIMNAITAIDQAIVAQATVEMICTVKFNIERLNTEFESFRQICMEFESTNADEAAAAAHNEAVAADFEVVLSKVSTSNGKARAYISEYESERANQSMNMSFGLNHSGSQPEAAVKLPRIEVPKFDGEIENFLEFCELFKSLIHDEPSIPRVRKLYYLKDSLKEGKAAELIADIPLTERGYDEAWTPLLSTYKDMKSIVRKHLDNLFSLPRIKSSSEIPNFLAKVNRFRKGIKACSEDPDSFYLSYVVSEKLDKNSFDEFERSLSSNAKFPSWDELHKFIEKRAFVSKRISDKVDQSEDKHNKSSKCDKKTVLATSLSSSSKKNSCSCCNQNSHLLINCDKFVAQSSDSRFKFIKEQNLCINCFGEHRVKSCNRAPNCDKCKFKHHTLLHFDEKQHSTSESP